MKNALKKKHLSVNHVEIITVNTTDIMIKKQKLGIAMIVIMTF